MVRDVGLATDVQAPGNPLAAQGSLGRTRVVLLRSSTEGLRLSAQVDCRLVSHKAESATCFTMIDFTLTVDPLAGKTAAGLLILDNRLRARNEARRQHK
jgi:hypothetical protein